MIDRRSILLTPQGRRRVLKAADAIDRVLNNAATPEEGRKRLARLREKLGAEVYRLGMEVAEGTQREAERAEGEAKNVIDADN